jgi:hypothetical protein
MNRQLTTIIVIGLLLAACNDNFTNTAAPQVESVPNAWIDSPLDGSTFPLGEIAIISHTQDLTGIARVELSVNGQVIRTDENPASSLTLFVISQPWTPSQPGDYLIQVRGQTTGGEWSNYAEVNITVTGVTATPEATFTASPTFTATNTPTETSTSTPAGFPKLTLTKNAFCRAGPNIAFRDITAIPAGDIVNIEGISEDGQWFYVFWEKFNVRCWVAASSGDVSGDVSGVPVLASPDLPTSTGVAPAVPTSPPTPTPEK